MNTDINNSRPVLLPESDNLSRPCVPSANIKPLNVTSKIPPMRSRLPTPRTNSVSDVSFSSPRTHGAYGFLPVGAADVFNNNQENENPLLPTTTTSKTVTISKATQKRRIGAPPSGPAAKVAKPQNLRVELLSNTKKAARRSITNALKISRNKAVKEAAVAKPGNNAKSGAVSKKPSSSVNTRKPVKTTRPATSAASNVSKPRSSIKPAARTTTAPVTKVQRSSTGSRSSGDNINPNTNAKKPKRKPWDLKGQVEDLKIELSSAKKNESMIPDILARLNALESEKTSISQEKTALGSDVQILQMKLRENEDHAQRLKNEYNELERQRTIEREDFLDQIRSIRNIRDELDLEVRRLKRELEESKESNRDLTKQNQEYVIDLKAKMEKIDKLEAELHLVHSDNSKMKDEISQNEADRRQLLNTVQELKGNIRVFCRVRPMLPKEEKEFGEMRHIEFIGNDNKSLMITNESSKPFSYSFDRVFNISTSQEVVFTEVSQLIESALDGYNVSIFAYGQTGAGKTYTMEGPDGGGEDQDGIIPRAMRLIFQRCEEKKKFDWTYNLAIQHVEIYREMLQDLLQNKDAKLEIKTVAKGGKQRVWVKNLSHHPVNNFKQVRRLLDQSKNKRATAATDANERSSRSHSVFILKIEAKNESTGEEIESSLNLIDLAGSERVAETGSSGTRLKEAQKINSSLMELSNVISSLANKESHIPYRNSKLTFLLMDSLGGNSKTLMVVNVNPVKRATSETINTLRFATTVNKCNIGTAQKAVKFN